MSSIEEDFQNSKPLEVLEREVEHFEDKTHKDLSDAIYDWAKGAVQGTQEIMRASDNLLTQDPDMLYAGFGTQEIMRGVDKTETQKDAHSWYDKAVETFNEETVKPAVTTAALLGSSYGAALMLPFIVNDWDKKAKDKGGTAAAYGEATLDTFTDMLPLYGSYKQMQDEDFQQYANEHPLRAAGLIVANEADFIAPALLTAKAVRRKTLKDAGKSEADITTIVDAEFKASDELLNKAGTPRKVQESQKLEADITDTDYKDIDVRLDEVRNTKRTLTPMEKVDSVSRPEVSKLMDDIGEQADMNYEIEVGKQLPYIGVKRAEIPVGTSNIKERVSLLDIKNTANKIATVRFGNVTGEKGTLGSYDIHSEGIHHKGHQALDVIAHELGHHLDFQVTKINGCTKELVAAARSVWGNKQFKQGNNKSATRLAYRKEGIAEFTAEYLFNPKMARENFPKYSKAFEEAMLRNPEVKKNFDLLGEQVRRWYTQTAEERLRGAMNLVGDEKPATLLDKAKNAVSDTIENFIDDTYITKRFEDDFEKQTGIKLADIERPSEMITALKSSVPACISVLLGQSPLETKYAIKALNALWGTNLKEVTFKEVIAPVVALAKADKYKEYLKAHNFESLYDAMATYMAALHNIEVINANNAKMEKAGKKLEGDTKSFATRRDSEAVINGAPLEFKEVAEKLKDYNSNYLQLAEHFGFISKEEAKTLHETYPYYVPFNRSFLEEGYKGTGGTGSSGKYVNQAPLIKALQMEGSDRTLADPIVGMHKQMAYLIEKGEKNHVAQQLVDMTITAKGNSRWIEKWNDKNRNIKEGVFSVWRDGKKEYYQATAPDVVHTILEMDKATASITSTIVGEMAKKAADSLRYGATNTLMFTLWNGIRDSFTAAIKSESGNTFTTLPIFNTVAGLALRNDKDLYANFYVQGVPYATRIGSDASLTRRLRKDTSYRTVDRKILEKVQENRLGRWLTKGLGFNQKVEEAARLYEFKQASKQGVNVKEAGRRAREITTNFARTGSSQYVKDTFKMIPFMNAVLQGHASMIRAYRRNPVAFAVRTAAYIVAPTLGLWLWNRDKEWYKELPVDEKMNNWFIEIGDTVYRFPKPELLGLLTGGGTEAVLNFYGSKDTKAFEGMTERIVKGAIPLSLPTFLLPVIEWTTNYSIFRGRNIVSEWDKKKAPEEQYNIYTSEVAKLLGRATKQSPMLIDNSIRDVTASVGDLALGLSDLILKENQAPKKQWDEWFRFTHSISPSRYNRTKEEFYKGWDEMQKEASRNKRFESTEKYKGMKAANREVSKKRKLYNEILKDPKKNGAKKRKEIDKINKEIRQIQRQANRKYLGYKYIQVVE